ncbi:MAG: DUF3783 domain-containing protein [Erysipelotrichales bacterium]|nr:DUF3783 domain-containing protein [Erysipelotrichales bacterium]
MKELILYYKLDENVKNIMSIILKQLDVEMKEIDEKDISQQMGYLLNLPGYQRKNIEREENLNETFLFFAHFSNEQLDIILDVFRNAGIPFIPYKAMLTNDNVVYTFQQLYKNVENEYKQLTHQN